MAEMISGIEAEGENAMSEQDLCIAVGETLQRKTDYQRTKEWRAKNPEKWRQQRLDYAARHVDQEKERKRKIAARHRANNPDKIIKRRAQYIENIGIEEKRNRDRAADARRKLNPEAKRRRLTAAAKLQLEKQEARAGRCRPDLCEACGGEGRICFDHCHETGKFRGWICDGCNRALGFVKDDIKRLENLIQYLKGAANE